MGLVYLVGAGPGDPALLTVRAAQVIASADVVVHDDRVNPAILNRCSPEAEQIRIGGSDGESQLSAEYSAALLIDRAGRVPSVVRLFGGDPFSTSRGGEEALQLVEAGISFEVVPGVSAGVAAPAYAGIPLRRTGTAVNVTFASGAASGDEAARNVSSGLTGGQGTLVFERCEENWEAVCKDLVSKGAAPDTPAALIAYGSYPRQRVEVGTLASLPSRAREFEVGPPAVLVVGDAVRLRDRLIWFETRPLSGRRIVVTRARAQAGEFTATLERLGAEVIHFPTIRITDPTEPEPLFQAARDADRFDWIVLTSVNGVERFWAALREVGRDARSLAGVSICAIGPATAAAIELHGVQPDLVPDRFVAEAVIEALAEEVELRGSRILIPRAEVARSVLPEELSAAGAEVVEVAAYRTDPDVREAAELQESLRAGSIDLITFTASSTVRNFVDLVGVDIGSAQVASIGPITSSTARELGLPVHLEAEEYTIPGLVQAIRKHFEQQQ